jgi:plastocyanin
MRWRKTVLVLVALAGALALPACGGGGSGSGGGATRTVLVDYNHDEVAGSFLAYFPRSVSVHPGDTVTFKQAWTGEPHSVTLGTAVDGLMREVLPLFEKYPNASGAEVKAQHPEDYAIYERVCLDGGKLPFDDKAICPAVPDMASFGGPDVLTMNQNGAQPCFLETGAPPRDVNTPCPKRTQPAFNGRQSYYSSGFIHYEGAQGNTFKMKLADDIKPGNYQYYCSLHGPGMSGAIEVVPTAKTVPSQSAVDRAARTQIDKQAKPMIAALKQAQAGKAVVDGKPFKGNLAGYGTDAIQEAFISEFIPNPIKAKVGEKVTWYVNGHTVSFDVPRYFPLATVAKDGKVTFNPRAVKAANSPIGEFPGGPPTNGPPPPPVDVDAGKWDGRGFISSGSPEGAINWSLTFTKAGTYKYACLIHPRMVGEVDVSG